jgi:hypothetical protein
MRQTVAELERLGAEFEYESFLPIRLHMVWGARISEHRFFQRLARVFAGEKFDDTHLAMLQHVRGLKSLYLDGTRVTNAGMKYVTKVTSLEELSLCFTAVDDNGLIHLKPLRHLRHLGLAYTDVGDAGVLQIRQFKDLETLWLHEDQVSETTLRTLERQLPKLEVSCVVE